MPKHVRNFWVETSIDGRETKDASGPAGHDGGFVTSIKVRENGTVRDALRIAGWSDGTGALVIEIDPRAEIEYTASGRIRITKQR